MEGISSQKIVIVGAGPVGALAAIYAATRGDAVEVYELREGRYLKTLRSPIYLQGRPLTLEIISPNYGKRNPPVFSLPLSCP